MKIDLARRTQIGRDRRAKTRAQLMKAAQTLYAERPVASITINDLVNEAGVAKGTFYVHFKHLGELQAAVAYELAQNFDDLLQPLRMALTDPVERVAAGCAAFIREALQNPAWGRLLANCAWALPPVASAANENLREDLELAMAQARLSTVALQLSVDIVTGVVLQTMRSAGERRLSPSDGEAAVAAILRAIGVPFGKAKAIAVRVFERRKSKTPARPIAQTSQAN